MTHKEWLKGLKDGTMVAVLDRYVYKIAIIRGDTPTRWKVNGEYFLKKDGKLYGGDDWRFASLRQPTLEILEKVRIADLKVKIKRKVANLKLSDNEGNLFELNRVLEKFQA